MVAERVSVSVCVLVALCVFGNCVGEKDGDLSASTESPENVIRPPEVTQQVKVSGRLTCEGKPQERKRLILMHDAEYPENNVLSTTLTDCDGNFSMFWEAAQSTDVQPYLLLIGADCNHSENVQARENCDGTNNKLTYDIARLNSSEPMPVQRNIGHQDLVEPCEVGNKRLTKEDCELIDCDQYLRRPPECSPLVIQQVEVYGTFECEGKPQTNKQVRLMDHITHIKDILLNTTRTDCDGNFYLTVEIRKRFDAELYLELIGTDCNHTENVPARENCNGTNNKLTHILTKLNRSEKTPVQRDIGYYDVIKLCGSEAEDRMVSEYRCTEDECDDEQALECPPSVTQQVEVYGRFTCEGKGQALKTVLLVYDNLFYKDNLLSTTHTDCEGNFYIFGEATKSFDVEPYLVLLGADCSHSENVLARENCNNTNNKLTHNITRLNQSEPMPVQRNIGNQDVIELCSSEEGKRLLEKDDCSQGCDDYLRRAPECAPLVTQQVEVSGRFMCADKAQANKLVTLMDDNYYYKDKQLNTTYTDCEGRFSIFGEATKRPNMEPYLVMEGPDCRGTNYRTAANCYGTGTVTYYVEKLNSSEPMPVQRHFELYDVTYLCGTLYDDGQAFLRF